MCLPANEQCTLNIQVSHAGVRDWPQILYSHNFEMTRFSQPWKGVRTPKCPSVQMLCPSWSSHVDFKWDVGTVKGKTVGPRRQSSMNGAVPGRMVSRANEGDLLINSILEWPCWTLTPTYLLSAGHHMRLFHQYSSREPAEYRGRWQRIPSNSGIH